MHAAPGVRTPLARLAEPARREASLVSAGGFRFLGVAGELSAIGWDGGQREKLWRYNQHYFDDLNAEAADEREAWHLALLQDWVDRNPAAQGTGWEPYPTSLRIVNWVKWRLRGHALPPACVQSLAVQARWLARRLEFHLLGNHLFANAKALMFAGFHFSGPEPDAWKARALGILTRELPEQILPDGGHFERSTMYHALALEDVLDLVNLLHAQAASLTDAERRLDLQLRGHAERMLRWLQLMRHPDGEIAFFNDAAFGIAPACEELLAYATRLGIAVPDAPGEGAYWLEHSGYARLQTPDAVLLIDMAPVGPDYLPGHAHADTLSFELSVQEQRVLVNSGTSCYGVGAERLRQRGTAAHNTVVLAGQDSSEVWSGFRVGRRACPVGPRVRSNGSCHEAECAHDGYTHLDGAPVHRRKWRLEPGMLVVIDEAGTAAAGQARFHLHPAVRAGEAENEQGVAVLSGTRRLLWEVARGSSSLRSSTWHPRFGESLNNQCLAVDLHHGVATTRFRWH